jgi:ethanolamine utilization protein EutQ
MPVESKPSERGPVVLLPAAGRQFVSMNPKSGTAEIARLIGPDRSQTMGAGIVTFDKCSNEWTVLYDEVMVVLEGVFRLRLAERVVEGRPGDVIWIPENTPLRYEGDGAVVFYALYPGDWRRRHGIA